MARDRFVPRPCAAVAGIPFPSAEEAWFWFVRAQEAKAAGARIAAARAEVPRPCEPIDLMRVIDGLYRHRRLIRDHLHVLAHYGRRSAAPDPERRREQRAWALWREAFGLIEPVLRGKGIVR